ncbi:calphotin-like [Spodoptera litura]|uniref:Calphotin-like n=1 Tax=Spodoptera litura TaxID=69820 RepID=A0A9J7DKS6_SPOLT|nr:calphotin-like [Spodoptera litura]
MKFFAAIVLVAAVASATPVERPSASEIIGHLVDAIAALKPEPVAVGPAIVGADLSPIAIGPAIIESPEPVAVGPAWIDFPLPDGGAAAAPVEPSPVAVIPGPVSSEIASGTPLVQIILNINQASAAPSPVAVGPAVVPEAIAPTPVHVVDVAPEPVHVVEVAPEPVHVVEVAPEPVQVVEVAPAPVEPVIIGVPILPEPVVALPEELN